MEPSHYAILLLTLCLALLAAEVFIPSGGIIFVVSLICLVGSALCAWKAWWTSSPFYWWVYIASLVLLIPSVVAGTFCVLPKTAYGKRILLEAPDLEDVTPYADEEAHLSKLIGRVGKTATLLNPGGLVLIDGERLHSESEGVMLDPGEDVEVIAVNGNRLVVRRASRPAGAADVLLAEPDDRENPPLDFGVSQS